MGLKRRRTGRGTSVVTPPEPQPASPGPAPLVVIDALGRKCPIPIIMLAERIGEVPVGQVIAVQADDVAARTDVPAWCRMKSQDFVWEETLPRGWSFHIRRTY
jgi:tRNA 2-thiouridine synthesizing protein A